MTDLHQAKAQLEEAKLAGDIGAEAKALSQVAELQVASNDLSRARASFAASAERYQEVGDVRNWERALTNAAVVLSRQAKWRDARLILERVLVSARSRHDRQSESDVVFNLSFVFLREGKAKASRNMARRSVELARESGDPLALGLALGNRGLAERALGDLPAALLSQAGAVEALRTLDAHREFAEALSNLGRVQQALGRDPEARASFEQSVDLLSHGRDVQALAGATLNLGTAQDPETSVQTFRAALELYRQCGDPYGEGIAQLNLGIRNIESEDASIREEGVRMVQEARRQLASLGAPESDLALEVLTRGAT